MRWIFSGAPPTSRTRVSCPSPTRRAVRPAGRLPDITSLHPLEQVSEAVGNLFSLLFDPAIRVNADGSCSANILESWEISEDGCEYTFSVRKNVAFHDASYGTVDAEDILFCLDYVVKHESAALHAYADGVES